MPKYRVQFDVKVPDGVNQEETIDWIKFSLHVSGGLSMHNPLSKEDLVAESSSVRIEKTG